MNLCIKNSSTNLRISYFWKSWSQLFFYLRQFLTRTEWWVIPLIWLPVVSWFISKSIRMGHTLSQIALIVLCGICIWTLLEYTLHRFLFHIKTKSYWLVFIALMTYSCLVCVFEIYFYERSSNCYRWTQISAIYRGNTIHYLLHGCHHKHPMDGLRLVFPPAATAVLCFPVRTILPINITYSIWIPHQFPATFP